MDGFGKDNAMDGNSNLDGMAPWDIDAGLRRIDKRLGRVHLMTLRFAKKMCDRLRESGRDVPEQMLGWEAEAKRLDVDRVLSEPEV